MTPIVHRELLSLLRTRKAVAAQLALALACALLVLVRWPSEGSSDLGGSARCRCLRVFGYGLLIGVLLLVRLSRPRRSCAEKVRGNACPASEFAAFGHFDLLRQAPGLAGLHRGSAADDDPRGGGLLRPRRGLGRGGVVMLYAVLMMAAVQIATLGLLVSSRAQTLDGALRTTYALVLAIALLPLVPFWLTQGSAGAEIADWVRCLSPIPAVMEVLGPERGRQPRDGRGAAPSFATCFCRGLWVSAVRRPRSGHWRPGRSIGAAPPA